jgi:hypothetical protein
LIEINPETGVIVIRVALYTSIIIYGNVLDLADFIYVFLFYTCILTYADRRKSISHTRLMPIVCRYKKNKQKHFSHVSNARGGCIRGVLLINALPEFEFSIPSVCCSSKIENLLLLILFVPVVESTRMRALSLTDWLRTRRRARHSYRP